MQRGFTLIELLVVIAIISILAAILFPVFAQAKNAAKGAVCISNMKQIGLASEMYIEDSDGVYYPVCFYQPLPGYAPQVFWISYDNNNAPLVNGVYGDVSRPAVNPPRPGLLDAYLKSPDITKCPNRANGQQSALALNDFRPGYPSDYYATNPAAQNNEYGPSQKTSFLINGVMCTTGASESEIQEPSATLVAWEHKAVAPFCNFLQPWDWFAIPPADEILKAHFNLLHDGGTNTLWCDSHAKRLAYGQLRRPYFSIRKDIYPGF